MGNYKIKVTYQCNDSEKKEIIIDSDQDSDTYSIELFILEEIMKEEEPDLLSLYSIVGSTPRGYRDQPGNRMPTNLELMEMHRITDLTYEINGCFYKIST